MIIYFNLFIKDNIVDDFNVFAYFFNDFKWFSIIIKMSKLYKVEEIDNTIKITTIDIVEFDFFYCNGSIYKGTIEVIYILKISMNFISMEEP